MGGIPPCANFYFTMDSFVSSADIMSCLFHCLHECAPLLGLLPRFSHRSVIRVVDRADHDIRLLAAQ